MHECGHTNRRNVCVHTYIYHLLISTCFAESSWDPHLGSLSAAPVEMLGSQHLIDFAAGMMIVVDFLRISYHTIHYLYML